MFRTILRTYLTTAEAIVGRAETSSKWMLSCPLLQKRLQCTRAGDWLVGQLQQLVDCAFKMATGQTEALRPIGLRLLRTLLRYFGTAEDPAMEGALLMEQYQAQFVSALRCGGRVSPACRAQVSGSQAAPLRLQLDSEAERLSLQAKQGTMLHDQG